MSNQIFIKGSDSYLAFGTIDAVLTVIRQGDKSLEKIKGGL